MTKTQFPAWQPIEKTSWYRANEIYYKSMIVAINRLVASETKKYLPEAPE